jgi:hypothetical protein
LKNGGAQAPPFCIGAAMLAEHFQQTEFLPLIF